MMTMRSIPYMLLGVLLLVVAGCAPRVRNARQVAPPSPPPKATASAMKTTLVGTNYRLVFPEGGPRTWIADVATIRADAGSGISELTKVSCLLYTQKRETLRVTADTGKVAVHGKTARLSLRGHVRVREPRQDLLLLADEFRWTTQQDTISAKNVRWQGLGFEHRADSGEFSTDLSHATFHGHVQTATVDTPTAQK